MSGDHPWSARVHVVGAGAMGARHVRVFAAAGAQVTVEDSVPSRARAAAACVEGVAACGPEAAAAARNEAHLVVVATPTNTHERVTLAALAAGAHVLVEKPLASTLRAAEAVARHAAQSDRSLFVGMSERFHPVVRALRRELASRGPGVSLRALSCRRFGPGSATQPALLNLGVHDVDLAMHLSFAELVVEGARAQGHDGAQLVLGAVGMAASRPARPSCSPAGRRRCASGVWWSSSPAARCSVATFSGRSCCGSSGRGWRRRRWRSRQASRCSCRRRPCWRRSVAPRRARPGTPSLAVASADDGVRALRIVEDAYTVMTRARSPSAYLAAGAAGVASSGSPAAEKL